MKKNITYLLMLLFLLILVICSCDSGNNKPFDTNKNTTGENQENPAKAHIDWMWSETTPCTEDVCKECIIDTKDPSNPQKRGSISAHDCVVEAIKATDPKLAENWLLCAQAHNPAAQQTLREQMQWCLEYIKSLKDNSGPPDNPAKAHIDWMWSEKVACSETICSECAIHSAAASDVKKRGKLSAHDCVVEAKKATDPKVAENWLICAQAHNPEAQKVIHNEIKWSLEYIKTLK